MGREPRLARGFFDPFEPVHAVTYFSPEARAADSGWGISPRGRLDGDGVITNAGRDLKQRIEDTTDLLALSALDALDDEEVEALFRTLTPITRMVVAAGDVPAATPMGLGRDDLDDDSAHLA